MTVFNVKAVCVQKGTVITIKVRFDLSRSESKMIDIFSQVFLSVLLYGMYLLLIIKKNVYLLVFISYQKQEVKFFTSMEALKALYIIS